MSDNETRILCRIEGKVQNVGYRAWTHAAAARLGVRGWIKNDADGHVSACFAGPREKVRELIEQCREGPPGADVTAITEKLATAEDVGGAAGFAVRG